MSTLHGAGPAPGVAPVEPMPSGIHNAYLFDVFNATSWSVILGAPMLLFLQHLHASATVIAVAASLSPILNILQIPSARFVERVGYRRFVLAGWTTRCFVIVAMAIVAFLPDSVDTATRIVLMLGLSLLFNILRGISSCGLLPWFTHIVPESRRGEFLARDQTGIALSGLMSLCLFGFLLSGDHRWYSFGILFSISALAGFVSLSFLRRIPDVPVQKIISNPMAPPWREMFFALGASGAFWVRFLHMKVGLSGSNVLFIACSTNVILLTALFLITPMIDRVGNKQVLTLSGICWALHFLGWGSVAAGAIPFCWTTIIVQAVTSGFGSALWTLANIRMVMGIVPVMGRPHFLALYTVASNLTIGTVPLIWGPILDYLEKWHVAWGIWNWNCYSLLYAALTFNMLIGLCVLQTLNEPKKMTWDVFISELLVKMPSRAISRVIGRLRGPSIG